ncbi:Protein of unknown function [Flavobacterium gillisiae]|uniref:Fibronectin type-III domain-containing protein n=1 Tax=Flavobacterium gillisiae TaxID=150146 RepID=A0A1H4GB02_9FLAO|nr:DUF1566 domain-containing protein [Flavobacterium gillisiae]SEB06441.1 Protein of unknown function [Flavobacterium gillisiae]
MKIKKYFKTIIAIVISTCAFNSCTDEFEYGKTQNAVKTLESSNILQTTALVSGTVITDNGSNLSARGICYGTSKNPNTSGLKKTDVTATLGTFTCALNNLSPSTTYYARAYASNNLGTAYGNEIAFTTQAATVPILSSTTDANQVTATSGNTGGTITNSGASNVISRGVCYSSTVTSPTTLDPKTNNGTGIGSFTSSLIGLTPNTTYYIRAYATNSIGTAYADVKSFRTTTATVPIGVKTTALSFTTQTTTIGGGNIYNDGGATISSRGVCWSNTTTSPTITSPKTIDGTGIGAFTSSITSLTPRTTYYVRAYATNSAGTAYGDTFSFTTVSATVPTGITTNSVSSITQTTAIGGGNINADGGATITSRGVCWSNTTSSPTISNSSTNNGSGTGSFSSSLTGLTPSTTYYVRAYATNSVGTAYSSTTSFTTSSATVPTGITTNPVSSITQTTAIGGGNINADGGATIISRGVCWSNTTSSPTISNSSTNNGSGTGSFSSSLTSLPPSTTYYVRAYATNSVGTAYSSTTSFTTSSATVPTGITTNSVSSITQTTAIGGGGFTLTVGETITEYGVCWSNTTSSPTVLNSKKIGLAPPGIGFNTFSSTLTGLTANTTYYVRAYATNSAGTAYGTTVTFTTPQNLVVGQSYQGGIIAYIFAAGDSGYVSGQTHGLIVTTSNQSTGAQWGCSGTNISGTSSSIGTGLANTTAIVSGCTTSGIAARICSDLVSGGYSDWYLPSYYELQKLYLNRSIIGGFTSTSYWSSYQYSSTMAYGISFVNGGAVSNTKTTPLYVRAIRKF